MKMTHEDGVDDKSTDTDTPAPKRHKSGDYDSQGKEPRFQTLCSGYILFLPNITSGAMSTHCTPDFP